MRAFAWLLIVITLPACRLVGEDASPYEAVAGSYEAVVFTEPGSHDGGIDVLALGGSLTAQLGENGSLSGRLTIPPSIHSSLPSFNVTYRGRYMVDGSTLRFDVWEPEGVLPFTEAEWQPDQQEIETFDQEGFMEAFKIILQREE